jgi:3-phenylpropionate/trans-cinnamate dioxygenase ferredoxin reductase subunit
MADRHVDHLLIGGGIACASAADALREHAPDSSILLVGRELDPPHHRPPITKGYLAGEETREQTHVHPPGWWEQHDVGLLTRTSVLELDTAARTAKLSNKETVSFGTALLATGAMVRRLSVDGDQLDGIHYLRALGNADSLRADIDGRDRVVMIGGSYIGCEVAATLTAAHGKRCTIVMMERLPLERQFGEQAGRFFADVLERHGVEIVAEDEIERFEGEERVQLVRTSGGRELPADVAVLGVGAHPDVMLARKAGLTLGEAGGVLATARLESSAPGIYVAGDICEYESPVHGRVLRIEHEDVAAQQGRTAALNMLGHGVEHTAVPYFFSDLADWVSLEYVGPAARWDTEVVRGSIEGGSFSIWYLDGGRLAATLAVGRGEDIEPAKALISAGARPDPALLADESRELTAV